MKYIYTNEWNIFHSHLVLKLFWKKEMMKWGAITNTTNTTSSTNSTNNHQHG